MRKIIETCGFHCIKIKNLGVSFGEQVVLKDVNLHIHCGSLNAIIGKNGAAYCAEGLLRLALSILYSSSVARRALLTEVSVLGKQK